MTIEQEIREHLTNADTREGEENLSLLVTQEVGKTHDRAAKAAELDAIIDQVRASVAPNSVDQKQNG